MKKMLGVLVLVLVLVAAPARAANNGVETGKSDDLYKELEAMVSEQLDSIDTSDWEQYLRYIEESGSRITKGKSAHEVIAGLLKGTYAVDIGEIFQEITMAFFSDLSSNLVLLAKIIVLAIICSIFNNMKSSFSNESVGEIGYFVCYSVAVILIVQSLINILTVGREGIDMMVGFMQTLFPMLIAMLAAMGNLATSALLQPAVGLMVGTVGTLLKNTMIPLISLSAVITLMNNVSDKIRLDKLGKLLKNLCVWILTGTFTIFIGVLTIQGAMTASFDGISVRTAKFAIDAFVPIMGKLFSQTVDTVVSCSLLVKNAVGVAGLIIIGMLCLIPALKILALLLTFKLSSALLEPVTDKRVVECLNDMGNILVVLFVSVVGIAIMFYLAVSLIIGTGNVSAMLR